MPEAPVVGPRSRPDCGLAAGGVHEGVGGGFLGISSGGDRSLTTVVWILVACEAMVVLLWVWGLVWLRGLYADEVMHVAPIPGEPPDRDSPRLAILIAAHNEQERIEPCLRSLLGQNYPNMHVIVANDRSDDLTGDRVRAVMAHDARVQHVEVNDLPPCWVGKTHALAVAAAQVQADYLLFMDCDCRFMPGALAAVMKKVLEDGVEFASLLPSLSLRTWSERLLTPPACWLLGLWAMLGRKRGEANSEIRLGNGQFLLFSQEAYRKVDGHASVRSELAEDLALASKAAERGLRRWSGMGKGLYITSRENTLSGTINALTRVLAGSLVKPWRLLVSPHLLWGGVAAPLWMLPLAVCCAGWTGCTAGWVLLSLALVHLGLVHTVVRKLCGMVLEETPSLWSFLAGSAVLGVLVHGAWLVATGRGGVRWGKTTYRVSGSQIVDIIPDAGPSAAKP